MGGDFNLEQQQLTVGEVHRNLPASALADPKRHLIGDDEHCWSDEGISRPRLQYEDWRRRLRHGRIDIRLRACHERRGTRDCAGGCESGARRGRGQ